MYYITLHKIPLRARAQRLHQQQANAVVPVTIVIIKDNYRKLSTGTTKGRWGLWLHLRRRFVCFCLRLIVGNIACVAGVTKSH